MTSSAMFPTPDVVYLATTATHTDVTTGTHVCMYNMQKQL